MPNQQKPFYGIAHCEIPQRIILNKPLYWFEGNNRDGNSYNYWQKRFKEITGYSFDNSHLKWSNIYGDLFAIAIYAHKEEWSISVWDSRGTTAVVDLSQKIVNKESDILSDENYRTLCEVTERYTLGEVRCSDCMTVIKRSEIAGRYFASVYCKKCWEGKWKAIEAKETYD